MRVWRYQGVHRAAWVVLALLILAVAVFAMAAGFARLRGEVDPAGAGGEPASAGAFRFGEAACGLSSVEPAAVAPTDLEASPVSV